MPLSFATFKDRISGRSRVPTTTSFSTQGTPARQVDIGIALPLYIYPAPGAWDPLYTALDKTPSTRFDIIINPNNGPQGPVPDSNYVSHIARLNSYDNVTLYGYIHMSWGQRDMNQIAADIGTYEAWSSFTEADIHVQGIFYDEAPTKLSCLSYVRDAHQRTKSTLTKGNKVWTNPGTIVHERFFAFADLINTFEDVHANWQTTTHIGRQYRNKSTFMVHTYRGSVAGLRRDVAAAVTDGYRSGLFTSNSGYEAFSTMWMDLIQGAKVGHDG